MSMTMTVELKSGFASLPDAFDPEAEGLVYGQTVPYAFDWLEAAANESAVAPLSDFLKKPDDHDHYRIDDWFDADAALPTVRGLIAYVRRNAPDPLVDGRSAVELDDLIWDLEVFASILEGAAASKEPFRFVGSI